MAISGFDFLTQFGSEFPPGFLTDSPSLAATRWRTAYHNTIQSSSTTTGKNWYYTKPGNLTLLNNYLMNFVLNGSESDPETMANYYWNAMTYYFAGELPPWTGLDPVGGGPAPIYPVRYGTPWVYAIVLDILNKSTFINNMKAYLTGGLGPPIDFFNVVYNDFIRQIATNDGGSVQ